ncbi:phosphorelay protein [Aquamicrobium defluvii]|uniref:Hpt domain-containing protein n=2 Tax=Aquamicrobium defluvii TaxID=69279 RepID=A0A4R6Y7K0_9HYPH|nr:phosphorelay protein [Aquamicrobium defluvii]TDR31316.1 hypothetical protein DES43_1345 [Aquamicrobium defluvii]
MNKGRHMASSGHAMESCGKVPASPVDLVHLERQTMGDRQLQSEVLNLLAEQARSTSLRVGSASPEERAAMAHGLKGAARGVGAFALADCADALEREPEVEQHRKRLEQAVAEFLNFLLRWEQQP